MWNSAALRRLVAVVLLLAALCAAAADRDSVLTLNPDIRAGMLPNGMRYFIQRSLRPAYKVNFYLVNNIGSSVEEDGEQGLAHFTEHMAFNGSRNFPGRSMLDILERSGLSFGYDINAATTLDNTTFRITYLDAVDHPGMVDTCLMMLRDIACDLTLADDAIDAERRIINEEFRQGNDVSRRMLTRMLPMLFGDSSRYASRMPIGDPGVLASFTPQQLRAFYKKWYQPQHQAIFVIGFVDPPTVEMAIKRIFSKIKAPKHPSQRRWQTVDNHSGIIGGVITDPEFPGCQIDLWHKVDIPPRDSRDRLGYLLDSFTGSMAFYILRNRLLDIPEEPGSPWSYGGVDFDQYYMADSKDAFRFLCLYDRRRRDDALRRLVEEEKRAALFGVTESELQMGRDFLRSRAAAMAGDYDERNNDEHFRSAVDFFTKGNIVLSPYDDARLMTAYADTVTVAAVNDFLRRWIRPDNMAAIMVEKDCGDTTVPDSAAFIAAVDSLWRVVVPSSPVDDSSWRKPLLESLPEPGRVVAALADSIFPARQYTFANGARATVCRSSVLQDQVDIRAVRRGGESVLLDSGYVDGFFAASLSDLAGVGDFSAADLRRKLSNTRVELSARTTAYADIIEGSSEIGELETLLQLLYLRMTTIRRDHKLFANWRDVRRASLADRQATPEAAFNDSIRIALYGPGHPYLRTLTPADIDTLDYDHALDLFASRIARPCDWDYIITGNFQPDSIVPLLEQYIGALPGPASPAQEPHHVVDRLAKDGVRTLAFSRDMPSPAAKAYLAWEIHRPYTLDDEMTLEVLSTILERTLLQRLRTDAGATYNVDVGNASSELDGFHSLFVSFDTAPETIDSLVADVRRALADIAAANPGISSDIDGNTSADTFAQTFASVHDYLLNEEYVATLQQHYPMEVFTHRALYHDTHREDRLPALAGVIPAAVSALAASLSTAPVRVTLLLTPR